MKTKLLILIAVLGLLAAACGPAKPLPPKEVVAVQVIDKAFKDAYLGMAALNAQAVPQEASWSGAFATWQESQSNFLVSAGESYRQVKQCYPDSEEVIVSGANAVFGADASGNPVGVANEQQAFINALASGGGLYAGDVEVCQQAAADFIVWARENRTTILNLRVDLRARESAYITWRDSDLTQRATISFLTQYGPYFEEMVADGSGAVLDAIAIEANLPPLEWDFVGFPTASLYAHVRSERICTQNMGYYKGVTSTPNGEHPNLFKTEWVDEQNGDCTLYRKAAWNYMTKLFISAQAAASQNCGVDAGFDQAIDPETCELVEPTPEPATPQSKGIAPSVVLAVFNEDDFYLENTPRKSVVEYR